MANVSTFLAQARRGDNRWFKYLLMLLSVIGIPYVLRYVSYYLVNYRIYGWVELLFRYSLFPNLLVIFFLWYLMPSLHRRSVKTLLNSEASFDWSKFTYSLIVSFGLIFSMASFSIMVMFDKPITWSWNSPDAKFDLLWQACSSFVGVLATMLLYRVYIFQAVSLLQRNAWNSIVMTTIVVWLMHKVYFFWLGITGYYPFESMSITMFLSSEILLDACILIVMVRDNGIELSLGFLLGLKLYSAMIDLPLLESRMYTPSSATSEQLIIYFFTDGWGTLICLGIFIWIVNRRFKLLPMSVLSEPIPKFKDSDKFSLIEEIGGGKKDE